MPLCPQANLWVIGSARYGVLQVLSGYLGTDMGQIGCGPVPGSGPDLRARIVAVKSLWFFSILGDFGSERGGEGSKGNTVSDPDSTLGVTVLSFDSIIRQPV